MTSVSAKFLQGEHQGRGEPSSLELQSSVVLLKNSEEDDLKTQTSSSAISSKEISSQNPTPAFTVHHQPFSQSVELQGSSNRDTSSSLSTSTTTSSSTLAPTSPSSSNIPLAYSNNPYYSSSSFFGCGKHSPGLRSNQNNLLGGNSGSPATPLFGSPSEMQQDFYRPYSLQTTTHLHHGSHHHTFGPPQPHHIIHHHPNSIISSPPPASSRLLLPSQTGCGDSSSSPPVTSSSATAVVPSSFNQSSSTSSTSSYNQNSSNSGSSTSVTPPSHLYSNTNSSSSPSNESSYQSSGNNPGGFIPPETYDRLYRPHPTRPAGSGPAMPPPTSSPVNSTASSVIASPAGNNPPPPIQGRSQFQRVISSSPSAPQSSPASSSLIMSNFSASSPPQAACSPTPSAAATPKFRYPSGPSGASPRTTTPSSTLSSREGTPLPSNASDSSAPVSAPNVDISRVHLEDFFHNHYSPSSSSSSSTPTRGAAAAIKSEFPQNPSSAFSSLSHYNSPGGFLYGPPAQQFLSSPSQQCITLSQRSVAQMRSKGGGLEFTGAPRGRRPGTSNLGPGGTNVKIGRRPAHLPKNLKFDDKTLPPGWVRKLKQRKHGKQAGRWDVYIYSPCGVKFASRKKLKSFFEKNNLNYDPEDFDFTPYGRHLDAAARANASSGNSSSNNSGGAASSSSAGGGSGVLSGSHGNPASVGSEIMVNSGRHNSSGSTGSEGTHEGSSPASLHNCSPTHPNSGHLYPGNSSSSSSFGATTGLSSHLSGVANEYTYPSFDPLMENPPNASALDVPPPSEIYNHRVPIQPHLKSDNSRISSPSYFPMEMAEILGDGSLNNGGSPHHHHHLNNESLHQSSHQQQQHHLHHQLHHIQQQQQQQSLPSSATSLNSFSDLRSRMLGDHDCGSGESSLSNSGEANVLPSSSNKMRPLLPNVASDMQPVEKAFSIRNTISLLESGNDPYTNYSEYD